ncbi:Zn-dependent hydrolase [Effusibacillus pohliae]|uniref:Zn-dependent hydrolase n=1 Tax=Effusibacillus pohliae TaxID=232270 RepID=UPI00036941C4|nr:Zn-dependent hydrolase [Effusibacillus pohliae]
MGDFHLFPIEERVRRDLETMSSFVDKTKPGWTRRPFTTWYEQARNWLKKEMIQCGLEVTVDAASNLIGRLPGKDPLLPPIMVGSHTDTVTGGGRFDGIIGVLAGLEIVRRIKETDTEMRHSFEIVDFTAEEPTEFGISTVGSRGMVNNLPVEMLERKDAAGRVLKECLEMAGGCPDEIPKRARKKGDVALYLELHIEQGPILEQTNHKLGVVTGIVGIHRYRVVVEGKPNHAGTTPMDMRYDALAGASEMVMALEHLCKEHFSEPLVGTVGKLTVEPNASNVIPGRVVFEMEVRSIEVTLIERVAKSFMQKARDIAFRRGLSVTFDLLSRSEAIRISPEVQQIIQQACLATTAATIRLPSGAGHDANQIARIAPIGMIFVPSKDGRSHCPEEWTDYKDVALGIEALARAVLQFDRMV